MVVEEIVVIAKAKHRISRTPTWSRHAGRAALKEEFRKSKEAVNQTKQHEKTKTHTQEC